jgi:hypothetical protein
MRALSFVLAIALAASGLFLDSEHRRAGTREPAASLGDS